MADAVPVKKPTPEQTKNFADELMNSWPMKVLANIIPGGNIIEDVLKVIINYVEAVEKAVAIKGAGVAKKSIVEDATVKFLIKKFPMLEPWKFIVEWGVDHIIDWIVDMKNKFGWDWIPIVNG